MDQGRYFRLLHLDTYGWIAVASLLICAGSGILLAIPYDVTNSYRSLFEMVLFNPAGSFVRNLHYWSAEVFLIFTLFHVYEHLSQSTERNIRNGRIWLLLCLVLFFIGYEMVSGFILKGDGAGVQARRILGSLLEAIPFLGKLLRNTLAGGEERWTIVYVQHIGLGTIFLLIGVYEHVRSIRPRRKTTVILLFALMLVALFFRAPLEMAESNDLRGPWFFLGIQELLHWISYPGIVVGMLSVFMFALIALPHLSDKHQGIIKRVLGISAVLYFLLCGVVLLFRGENWQWKWGDFNKSPIHYAPLFSGGRSTVDRLSDSIQPEGCMVCHGAMKGLSDAHHPAQMGCFACHLGDPFTVDKRLAHRKMVMVPGDFSNVRQTCGTQNCHPDITKRMMSSLMTTASGLVGVDKFVFGEASSPNDTFQMSSLKHSMADTHLRNLCAGCHLGREKFKPGQPGWLERGGGCNACHLFYDESAAGSLKRMQSKNYVAGLEVHPAIDIRVTNDRCMSCHSRSGRISLNYEGWSETSLQPGAVTDTVHFKILPDDRVVEKMAADVHHQKGMACIDCHGSYEVMGDGKHPVHKEDAVNIQCVDCHPAGKPNQATIGELSDHESLMIAGLRHLNPATRVVMTKKANQPILNTSIDSMGQIVLKDKLTGAIHHSKPMSKFCRRGSGHQRLTCESCHTAWVPQCIGCHNAFEKSSPGRDLLTGKPATGTWVEYAGKIFPEPPVLGVNENEGGKIVTVMPGMVMTIDRESFTPGTGSSFFRLFAPASGHTTQRQGRGCKSCHNDPLAIGYGRGELKYLPTGNAVHWTFTPRFAANPNDRLPEDGWIGFMEEMNQPHATRTGLRPFTVAEQKKVLEVGSCLTCHEENSRVMELTLENFEQTKAKRSKRCFK